jgi:uncharacterized membrane protein YqjE
MLVLGLDIWYPTMGLAIFRTKSKMLVHVLKLLYFAEIDLVFLNHALVNMMLFIMWSFHSSKGMGFPMQKLFIA